MKTIYYWSPCLTNVGTLKSTINSSISLSKYSQNQFKVKIINICGEWNEYRDIFRKNNVEVQDLSFSYFKYLPKKGFFQSRFSYFVIFLISFVPLLYLIKKKKPDILIIHLLTSLPLLLLNLFNFNTKFILRISGYPKLNFWRKIYWTISLKKIYKITCPTHDLIKQLKDLNIFQSHKITFLPDAIINIESFREQIKSKNILKVPKKYFLAVGRLTRQKNFSYLIDEFLEFSKKNEDINLLIFGEGEQKKELLNKISIYSLEKRVFLMGHSKKIYYYMKNASAFILSSLWEEPGFVIIEAALSNLFIISSDCYNGPKEFLLNGEAGILFKNNIRGELKKKLEEFSSIKDTNQLKLKKIKAKKNCIKYTMFRHNIYLKKIISL